MPFDPKKVTEGVVNALMYHYGNLTMNLFFFPPKFNPVLPFTQSPIAEEVKLLCSAANGEIDRSKADIDTIGEITETIQHIAEVMNVAPAGSYHYNIPAAFWTSEIGQVILHAQLWVRNDVLITHREAAQLLYGNDDTVSLNKLRRSIARGNLTQYSDPSESNPQRAGRLSRYEVMQLGMK